MELLANRGNDSRHHRAPWAGIDTACWDLIGKATGKPVYELLAVDGAPDPAVGPDFRLMHEAMGMNLGSLEAVITEFALVLEDLGFYWFEEAFGGTQFDHIELFLQLKEATPTVLVSGGERFLERFEAQEWLDHRALDIVQSDCNVTGLTENWYIARMANQRGIRSIPHNWHGGGTTMVNAHFVAAIPNREYCELNQTYNPLKEGIFKEPLTVEDGVMTLSNKPGYGVELIDDMEKVFPYEPGAYMQPNPRVQSQ